MPDVRRAVRTDAQVRRVAVEAGGAGPRAAGVELLSSERLTARREVILAAGAIGSPQILQLSGVGPGALLQRHGVDVVHDLPGVGENLYDHLQIRSIYRVKNTVTLNRRANSLFGKAAMGLEYPLFRAGPLTPAPTARRIRRAAASRGLRAGLLPAPATQRFVCSRTETL